MMKSFDVVASFQSKEGQETALEALLTTMLEPTRAEPGCINYDLFHVADEPGSFLFIEAFQDAEAFKAHQQQPHFINLLNELPELLVSEPKVMILENAE